MSVALTDPLMAQWLLGLALTAPWLVLLAILPARVTRCPAAALTPWAALPALLAALLLPEATAIRLPAWLAGIGFAMDETARVFLLAASLIWGLAGWFALEWLEANRRTLFLGFWLATLGGSLGLILAQDLLGFYTAFAVMSFAAYALVIHDGTPRALRAGRLYLAMMVLGELSMLTAVALAALHAAPGEVPGFEAAGRTQAGLALLAVAFGIKLALLGLHGWLPQAHPAAPVPASAVLSGVMIKAGLLGWLRLAEPQLAALSTWGPPVMALGLAAVFYGVLMGLPRKDPKTLLAWSSISQMGLMTLFTGVALLPASGWPAARDGVALFALHHGLAKGALFLGVGIMVTASAMWHRLAWAALWLPALALIGAPGTSGALAKRTLELAGVQSGQEPWLAPTLYAAAVASTLLMARFMYLVHRPQAGGAPARARPGRLWMPWTALLLAVLIVPWAWPAAPPAAEVLSPAAVYGALWPLLLGLALAGGALALGARFPAPSPAQGAMLERAVAALTERWPTAWPLRLARLEQRLHHWPLVGQLAVLVLLALLGVVWWDGR